MKILFLLRYHDHINVSRSLSGINAFESQLCKYYANTIFVELLAKERSFTLPYIYILPNPPTQKVHLHSEEMDQ